HADRREPEALAGGGDGVDEPAGEAPQADLGGAIGNRREQRGREQPDEGLDALVLAQAAAAVRAPPHVGPEGAPGLRREAAVEEAGEQAGGASMGHGTSSPRSRSRSRGARRARSSSRPRRSQVPTVGSGTPSRSAISVLESPQTMRSTSARRCWGFTSSSAEATAERISDRKSTRLNSSHV